MVHNGMCVMIRQCCNKFCRQPHDTTRHDRQTIPRITNEAESPTNHQSGGRRERRYEKASRMCHTPIGWESRWMGDLFTNANGNLICESSHLTGISLEDTDNCLVSSTLHDRRCKEQSEPCRLAITIPLISMPQSNQFINFKG